MQRYGWLMMMLKRYDGLSHCWEGMHGLVTADDDADAHTKAKYSCKWIFFCTWEFRCLRCFGP